MESSESPTSNGPPEKKASTEKVQLSQREKDQLDRIQKLI
jgi:hypothetical protein